MPGNLEDFINFIDKPSQLMESGLSELGRRWDSLGQGGRHPGPNPTAEAIAGREASQLSRQREGERPLMERLARNTASPLQVLYPNVSEEERAMMLEAARGQVEARDLGRASPQRGRERNAQSQMTDEDWADLLEIEAMMNEARGGGRMPDPDPYTREDHRRGLMDLVVQGTMPENQSPQATHSWQFEDALREAAPQYRQAPSQRRDVEQGRVQGRGGMTLQDQLEMDEINRMMEAQRRAQR